MLKTQLLYVCNKIATYSVYIFTLLIPIHFNAYIPPVHYTFFAVNKLINGNRTNRNADSLPARLQNRAQAGI